MTKRDATKYRLSNEWKITQTAKLLMLSGGADSRYEIELENEGPTFFVLDKAYKPFVKNDLNESDKATLQQLITAEIVVPVLNKNEQMRVAKLGDSSENYVFHSKDLLFVKDPKNADVIVIERLTSTYAELLEQTSYQSIYKPHLLLELAFNHTISIGPLVFPGETACIACLQGRVTTRWGDDNPPKEPRATKAYRHLANEMLETELLRIARGETSLTNKTYALNVKDRTIITNQLLKVPICPICTNNTVDPDGSIGLPWIKT